MLLFDSSLVHVCMWVWVARGFGLHLTLGELSVECDVRLCTLCGRFCHLTPEIFVGLVWLRCC